MSASATHGSSRTRSVSAFPRFVRRHLGLGAWLCALPAGAIDYHVDALAGDDARDGRAPARAWRSFAPANATIFAPGDRILLKAGGVWRGTALQPGGSGKAGTPITIGRYGEGPPPALHGDGRVEAVVRLLNQEHWEIAHLEITNRSPGPEFPARRGVEIRARDAGWLRGIHLHDLHIHDINGPPANFPDGEPQRKNFGGIMLLIEGTEKPTAWDGVLIEGCHIHDVSATGLATASSWARGHRTNDPATWFPSRRVVIRHNLFERTARDGVIVRASVAPLVEHNRFLECAIEANGVGCFAFDCDDAVFQFNEAAHTRYNPGDTDASGFDSDWNCRRTVIQFNYSHDNDYGFVLLCCDGRWGFNDDSIVRYNISQNDGGNVIRVSGTVKRARIYNNTIYVGPGMDNPRNGDPPRIVYHKSWDGWSDDVLLANNIIINHSERAIYEFGQSRNNTYEGNLFFGRHPSSEPVDPRKQTFDPLLAAAGRAASREDAALAYRPASRSPVRAAGLIQPASPPADFAGRPVVPKDGKVDLGALGAAPEEPRP